MVQDYVLHGTGLWFSWYKTMYFMVQNYDFHGTGLWFYDSNICKKTKITLNMT